KWLCDAGNADDPTPIGVVKLGILFRSANQHRAIVNLLSTNHVEDALILTRALFELTLHTEELVRDSSALHDRALRYLRFCRLQIYLESRQIYVLRRASGLPVSGPLHDVAEVDRRAKEEFAAFAFTDRKGRHRWFANWCNKTVAALAEQSSNPMRTAQYRVLYAKGSQIVHAGPSSVFPAIYPDGVPPDIATAVGHQRDVEEEHLRLAASFSSVFLDEIFGMLFDRLPTFSPSWLPEVVAKYCEEIMAGR
ncbi:MAG: DUF5677 domain-containing protein, partial [Candidatus Binatia bacterium]